MKKLTLHSALVISVGWFGSTALAETTVTIEKKKSDAFYSPFGKRDPFRVPTVGGLGEDSSVGPLQRFHVDQFRLRAILRGIGEPKAMFQDPKGRSHIVRQGDVIGIERATVSRIIKSEVILTERTYNYLGKESLLEKVIALPQDTELDPLQLVNSDAVAPSDESDPNRAKNFENLEEWTGEVRRTEPAPARSEPPRATASPAASAPASAPAVPSTSVVVTPPPVTSPVLGINDPAANPPPSTVNSNGYAPIPGAGTAETGNTGTPLDANASVRNADTPLPPPSAPVPVSGTTP